MKKRDKAELREFDLNEVIQDALEIIVPEARRKGVEVSSSNVHGALPVRGDQVQVQQVILNLAMNAIDAMSDCNPAQKKMSINSAIVERSSVEISVANSGIGIPPDRLNHVFAAFYTTKGHGTGLGLSIARTIVEMYGGRIWAENRAGGGSIPSLHLAASADFAQHHESAVRGLASTASSTLLELARPPDSSRFHSLLLRDQRGPRPAADRFGVTPQHTSRPKGTSSQWRGSLVISGACIAVYSERSGK